MRERERGRIGTQDDAETGQIRAFFLRGLKLWSHRTRCFRKRDLSPDRQIRNRGLEPAANGARDGSTAFSASARREARITSSGHQGGETCLALQ